MTQVSNLSYKALSNGDGQLVVGEKHFIRLVFSSKLWTRTSIVSNVVTMPVAECAIEEVEKWTPLHVNLVG